MTATLPSTKGQTAAEAAAHAILELVATHPGHFGRLRSSRIVGGFAVPVDDPDVIASTRPYSSVALQWTLQDLVALVDALLSGGLLSQTTGARPTLVVTRAGHRALDALESVPFHSDERAGSAPTVGDR